ncbi:MAG: glycosyltransferase family 4 protein [Candidatus Cloacimonadota bacterium]|nr:glycosyltransferase family 4 protein [Candidatus Cloacimonadota bacterium]
MNIWIFNHHALTPDMSGGTRHFDFAKALVERGHSVSIIASSFHYSKYQELKNYENSHYLHEKIDGVDFIWIKTRPYYGNGTTRVINMLDYMYKALHVKIENKPDIIIGSSVHLFAVYAAYKIAKKYHIPFVMEVRDIWPKTLIDLGMSKWHPFILLLGFLEKFLYKKAEKIISLLPYAYEHIATLGIPKDKIIWIPNGVDLSRNGTIKAFSFLQKSQFNIVYAGAIGEANQINVLIQTAKLCEKITDTHFHIIGDGPQRKFLESQKTDNVTFYGALSKNDAIAKINGANILFFPLADSPIFNFGISSNKLFDYLASKKPIIFASNAKNNPIKDANAGISVKANDPLAVKEAIVKLKALPNEEIINLGNNGFKYVSEHHAISILSKKLEAKLVSIEYNFKQKLIKVK